MRFSLVVFSDVSSVAQPDMRFDIFSLTRRDAAVLNTILIVVYFKIVTG